MTDLFFLEPDEGDAWYPFVDCRPVCELRVGAWLVRERWEGVSRAESAAIFARRHLHGFVEDGTPPVRERSPVAGPAFVARSDFAPSGAAPTLPKGPASLVNDGVVVGWWVPEGTTWNGELSGAQEVEIEGVALLGAWDVITGMEHLLAADVADFTHEP
ncbi:MAG: hypothetical protein IH877_10095, partial [Gemmatimonadetes bacterium]|nr:hypothetical protein [Gemmatimonadota bacterium]